MKQFFERENLIPRIVTLIVACGLWLYVMSEQNPVIERDFVVKLQQRNVAENMVVLNAPDNIKVKVSGQRSPSGRRNGKRSYCLYRLRRARCGAAVSAGACSVPGRAGCRSLSE